MPRQKSQDGCLKSKRPQKKNTPSSTLLTKVAVFDIIGSWPEDSDALCSALRDVHGQLVALWELCGASGPQHHRGHVFQIFTSTEVSTKHTKSLPPQRVLVTTLNQQLDKTKRQVNFFNLPAQAATPKFSLESTGPIYLAEDISKANIYFGWWRPWEFTFRAWRYILKKKCIAEPFKPETLAIRSSSLSGDFQ